MMGEEEGEELSWCLRRLGGKAERLLLPEGEEVTVGRGIGVTYQLVSTSCPLMISRTHCTFHQNTAGQWTVTDNNSLNGVWVNKVRILPQKPQALTNGSCVQLGVPLSNAEKPEFEYEVVQEILEEIRPFLFPALVNKGKTQRTKRKLSCDDCEASEVGTSGMSRAKLQKSEGHPFKLPKTDLSKQPTVLAEQLELDSDNLPATQQQCTNTLQLSKVRDSIAELRSLSAQVQEKHSDLQKMNLQQNPSEDIQSLQKCQQELTELQKQIVIRRKEHLQRVNELQSINSLDAFQATEENVLKEQLSKLLQEHSLVMEELNRQHQELQETKKEKEKMEAIHHMNDVLDNELQCIICSEHFIEAVTLNCAHSFCSFCIQSWRKRKDECPICRQAITSQTRSLALDNCINCMVNKLSQEMKDRRMALILERKDQAQAAFAILIESDSSSSSDIAFLSLVDGEDENLSMDSDLSLDSEDDYYVSLI